MRRLSTASASRSCVWLVPVQLLFTTREPFLIAVLVLVAPGSLGSEGLFRRVFRVQGQSSQFVGRNTRAYSENEQVPRGKLTALPTSGLGGRISAGRAQGRVPAAAVMRHEVLLCGGSLTGGTGYERDAGEGW